MKGHRAQTGAPTLSVVTPTLRRPEEVKGLLENLSRQTYLPHEVILVDGAPDGEHDTEAVVEAVAPAFPFRVCYLRHGGGTAIQRNVGIDAAMGDFIALLDDDIRLEPDFYEIILAAFAEDAEGEVGGITGYITNQYLDAQTSPRWTWNRRLRLYTTYEPGRYDFQTGYPINRYMQPPHDGLKPIDFMGAGCAVWRRQVFDEGLRFSEFFVGFGVLEDAHLALRAGKRWRLLECGRARCIHLKSETSREDARLVSWKTAVNYRYVFMDIVPERTWKQEFRFWRVQFWDLFRFVVSAVRFGGKERWQQVLGKAEGIVAAFRLRPTTQEQETYEALA